MKKIILGLALISLILPTIFAIDLNVEVLNENHALIEGSGDSVLYEISITNEGSKGTFAVYNLLGFPMSESEISLESEETQRLSLEIEPASSFDHPGNYLFDLYFMDRNGQDQKEELDLKVVELGDVFEAGSGDVNSQENTLQIYIKNKENINFEEVKAKFSSVFFEFEEDFSLEPYERKSFEVELNKEDFDELSAGFYTLEVSLESKKQEAKIEGVINFPEQDVLKTNEDSYGFIIVTKVIEKKNEGNVAKDVSIEIEKNIISRLFTNFEPKPDVVNRKGFSVFYEWNERVEPGEILEVRIRTNWIFPILIILFVIVIVVMAKRFVATNLSMKKKVSFVRAKGGEFALKVSLIIHAKKYLERVSVTDRLPPLVKIYERFGSEKPSKIDEKNKFIRWEFEKLEAGEVRVLSYIIYSKVGVMGKFALPSASAIFEREGEVKESSSNKAFFVTEPKDD